MMIVLMLAGGATRTVHAAQWPSPHGGLPGTPIGGAQPNRAIFLVFNENGTLITLPFQSIPGDLVLCESACQEDPSSWSDVLRFCDTPLNDAACQSATTTTHAQLFTGGEGAIAGFTDEFTFHSLDASKLSANVLGIDESTTGPTIFEAPTIGTFTINSDPTGPGEVVEHPVGGHVVSIDMVALLVPWFAVIGVLGCAVVVAVAVKKHRQ
jgi:hypothetical protein